ncbi:MAG: hypothetical protein K2Q26_06690 [Bdellovibrionales bacterium]|nr:hypothetical protein [Bdellovibrionales bacterium]
MTKVIFSLFTIFIATSCTSSSKPLPNAEGAATAGFQEGTDMGGYNQYKFEGLDCKEVKPEALAECKVERLTITYGSDLKLHETDGAVTRMALPIPTSDVTVKKGDVVTFTGTFELVMSSTRLGMKTWKTTGLKLKKV